MMRISRVILMTVLAFAAAFVAVLASTVSETNAKEGDPPRILENVNTRETVKAGARVFRLHCPVESDTHLMIQWHKDGELIGPAWGDRFRFGNQQRTLRVKNVIVEDTGRYSCEAVNGFGRRVVDFTVIVYDKDDHNSDFGKYEYSPDAKNVAPVWVNPSEMRRLTSAPLVKTVGASQRLNCAASADPRPQVTWYRNGRPFRSYETRNRWALDLTRLSLVDSATYECRLLNAFGSLNATFRLQVIERDRQPPEFDSSPHSLANSTVTEGHMATFQCKVKSVILPHIKWLKQVDDRSSVTDNSSVFQAQGMNLMVLDNYPSETIAQKNNTYVNQLVLPSVQSRNSGWYICVVTSATGHMLYRKAHLKVLTGVQRMTLPEAITATHLYVGIPLVLLVAVLVGYAIYFLQRHQQQHNKPPRCKLASSGIALRPHPPPPTRPPPVAPAAAAALSNSYKGTPSPRHSALNYVRPEQRQLMMTSSAYYTQSPGLYSNVDALTAAGYHHLEPHLADAYRHHGIYETTPQPPMSRLGAWQCASDDDSDSLPDASLQHYPSLYSSTHNER